MRQPVSTAMSQEGGLAGNIHGRRIECSTSLHLVFYELNNTGTFIGCCALQQSAGVMTAHSVTPRCSVTAVTSFCTTLAVASDLTVSSHERPELFATSRKVAGLKHDETNDFFFSIYRILPATLVPGVYSDRNEDQNQKNNFSGEQRAVGA
jgi:hypothetical protein